MKVSYQEIPSGLAGTDATLSKIIELTRSSLRRAPLRLATNSILGAAGIQDGRQHGEIARVIYDWVKANIRFVNDPVDVETVADPEIVLNLGYGDCDDQSGLVAAMAMSVGVPARFVVLGDSPESFRHIYTELFFDGEWHPVDTTSPRGFAEPVPPIGVKKIYNIVEGLKNMQMADTQVLPIRRDAAGQMVQSYVWDQLWAAWNAGTIDMSDLKNFLASIDAGAWEFSGNTFFEPAIKDTVNNFVAYIVNNGLPSHKLDTAYLSGLSGFFNDLWQGVKSVIKPAATIAATVILGPAAGAAVGGVLYGGGGGATTSAGGAVTVPAGQGSVTYNPNAPVSTYQPGVPFGTTITGLLSNPVVLIGLGVLVVVLLTRKK